VDRNELREELLAVLAANRELTGEQDEALVESFLARLEATQPHRPLIRLREIYEQLVPLTFPTVLVIAAAQGVTLFTLGAYLLQRLDFYYGADGFVQAWVVFGFMWLAEVLVTIAVLSILAPREKPAPGRSTAGRRLQL